MSGQNDEPTPTKGEPTPMTEETTPQEPAAEGPTAEETARAARLTERLLARATHPLGLIDVRRAERHYARVMDWLAARTPLVEHLRSRYGLMEDEGSATLGLAFADAHESEGAVNLYAAPDRFTSRDAGHLFTAVAQIPDDSAAQTGAKRIARRGVPTFSHAGSETDSAARQERNEVASHERSGGVRQEQVEVFEMDRSEIFELDRSEVFRPAHGRAEPNQEQARAPLSHSSAKEIPAANAGASASRADVQTPRTRAARAPSEESAPAPTQTVTRLPILSVEESAMFSTGEQDKTLARGTTVVNETKDADGATVASESRGAAKPDASSVSESSGASARPPATPSRAHVGVRENKSAAVADAEIEEEELTLGRGVEGRGARRPVSGAAGERVLVTIEIPADDPRRESPTLHAQSPLPLASAPSAPAREEAARRQNVSASIAAPPPPAAETFTHGRGRAGARAEEINVERLTEQVSRHLARRLQVERERRRLGRR